MEDGYKSCPHCAEPIREAATVCRYCNRTVGAESKPPTIPIVAKNPWRAILSIAALFAILLLLFWGYTQSRQVGGGPMNPFEAKQWYEISRTLGQSQVIDVRRFSGWLHEPIARMGDNVKVFLICHCAASEPERVVFAVMDEENFQRMQAGYPPFARSAPVGSPTEQEIPYGGRYWFGFVELASKQSAPEKIPLNVPGALLYLLNQYQTQNRPPVRVTAEIYSSVKIYTTATEARRAISAAQQRGQSSLPSVPPSQSSNPQQTAAENELRAVGNVRVIFTAVTTYCNAYQHPPRSLADLASDNLINSDLASGQTSGYTLSLFTLSCEVYTVAARPVVWNSTGTLSLFLDNAGDLHATRENRQATVADPVLASSAQ